MKYGLVAWVVLAGCVRVAPHETTSRVVVPAPPALTPKPLAVGQWALYREREPGVDEDGFARFEVVSTAACGTWVRVSLCGRGESRLWMLCVNESGRIDTAVFDGRDAVDPSAPGEHAADLAGMQSRIAPHAADVDAARDDVGTPAGNFEQAVVVRTVKGTTWVDPVVPLAGVVKIVDGDSGREDVLVDFGSQPRREPPKPAAHDGTYADLGRASARSCSTFPERSPTPRAS